MGAPKSINQHLNGQKEQAMYNGASHMPPVHTEVSAIADTSTQSDLWSLLDFFAREFSRDLLRVSISLSAANLSPLSVEGAFFARLTRRSHSGKEGSCCYVVYVCSHIQAMCLSYEYC